MHAVKRIAILVSMTSVLALGCTTHGHAIYNVHGAPVATRSGKGLSMGEISQAIVRAGAATGWVVQPTGPGQLTGRNIFGRDGRHVATISIEHDTKTYSIKYKDSQNLAATPENTIHRAYNEKVQALDRAISEQLSLM
jgi:hypothetical protein